MRIEIVSKDGEYGEELEAVQKPFFLVNFTDSNLKV